MAPLLIAILWMTVVVWSISFFCDLLLLSVLHLRDICLLLGLAHPVEVLPEDRMETPDADAPTRSGHHQGQCIGSARIGRYMLWYFWYVMYIAFSETYMRLPLPTR